MKVGIITDIHSNIQALNAVLDKFNELKVDKIICCGDIVGIGINPEEVVQALMNKKDMLIAVRGNHEQYLLNGLPEYVHDDKRRMSDEEIANHNWNHNKLSKESKSFLAELELTKTIEIEGKKIYIVHYPLKEDNESYKEIIKEPDIIKCKEMFTNINADIFLYGHTHTYSVNTEENKWYINAGSLGCPKGRNAAQAGILEINNEEITFNSINVNYDIKDVVEKIKSIKAPFCEKVLQIFYGV